MKMLYNIRLCGLFLSVVLLVSAACSKQENTSLIANSFRYDKIYEEGSVVEIVLEDRGTPFLHPEEYWVHTSFVFKMTDGKFVLQNVTEGCAIRGTWDMTEEYRPCVLLDWADTGDALPGFLFNSYLHGWFCKRFHFRIMSSGHYDDETMDQKSIFCDNECIYPVNGFKTISKNIIGVYHEGYNLMDGTIELVPCPKYDSTDMNDYYL